jgi:hypothetical protein
MISMRREHPQMLDEERASSDAVYKNGIRDALLRK